MTRKKFYIYRDASKAESHEDLRLFESTAKVLDSYGMSAELLTDDMIVDSLVPDNFSEIVIVSDIEAPAVERLIRLKWRVVSMLVVAYCDPGLLPTPYQSIPNRPYPLYSQCMRSLEVTSTNLKTSMRAVLESKVCKMGGVWDGSLKALTDFLVSDSVLSLKYREAIKMKTVKIVTVDWVLKCWDVYQHQFARADDPNIYGKYLLPIFHGLNICVSQVCLFILQI